MASNHIPPPPDKSPHLCSSTHCNCWHVTGLLWEPSSALLSTRGYIYYRPPPPQSVGLYHHDHQGRHHPPINWPSRATDNNPQPATHNGSLTQCQTRAVRLWRPASPIHGGGPVANHHQRSLDARSDLSDRQAACFTFCIVVVHPITPPPRAQIHPVWRGGPVTD
jgi:hypothetical protein